MNKKAVDAKIDAAVRSESESEFSLDRLVEDIRERLNEGLHLRRNVMSEGRLRVDRSLPFLCVYRRPAAASDVGTRELVTTEASYLFVSGKSEAYSDAATICQVVRDVSLERFNAFLLIEIWSETKKNDQNHDFDCSSYDQQPAFTVFAPQSAKLKSTIDTFNSTLKKIHISERYSDVTIHWGNDCSPPALRPLLVNRDASPETSASHPGDAELNVAHQAAGQFYSIGIAVAPVFRSSDGDTLFPIVLQQLRSQLAVAIRKMLFTFTKDVLDDAPVGYHALGPTAMVKAVSLVDQQLCDVASSFDYLLQITPTNSTEAWKEFKTGNFTKAPKFYYRPLPHRPAELKRDLFDVPIDRIEDSTLADLFWEKQEELDHQITSLKDIDTPAFLYGSLQIYGEVESDLLAIAESLLQNSLDDEFEDAAATSTGEQWVGCDELVEKAREEIAYYRELDPNFHAMVKRSSSIAAGMMVSKDTVLIDKTVKVNARRLDGLMQHEIGTHLLTYFNGRQQPLQQMFAGLAGYESFQEGIAVLAEYLAGGLTGSRIRTLAARVVGAKMLVEGYSFIETFHRLCDQYQFSKYSAFSITTRIFRGGGTTKDAIYLCGLQDVLAYLSESEGADTDLLFVGKISKTHIPAINDLVQRQIIKPPSLLPRFLNDDVGRNRFDACIGKNVIEILTNDLF